MQHLSDAFPHALRGRRTALFLLTLAVIAAAAVACRGGGSNPSESQQVLPVVQPTVSQANCVNQVQPSDAIQFDDIDNSLFQVLPNVEGLRFYDIEEGSGDMPTLADAVAVEYTGWLENGCMFDTSFPNPDPVTFPLVNVIRGWQAGISSMQEGGKRVIAVDPDLGYGTTGFPPRIPPNATLIFYIELINRITLSEAQATVEAERANATAEAQSASETATAEAATAEAEGTEVPEPTAEVTAEATAETEGVAEASAVASESESISVPE